MVEAYALTLARVSGVLMWLPGMGPGEVPIPISVFVAAALAWGVGPVHPGGLPTTVAGLALVAVGNLVLGMLMAYGARVLYATAMLSGQMAGVVAGVSAAEAISPVAVPVPAVGNLLSIGTLALLYGSGGIAVVLAALHRSFGVWPLGDPALGLVGASLPRITALLVRSLGLAVGVAGPVVGAELAALLVVGLLGRAMPQANLLTVSLPLQLAVFAVLLLVLSGPLAAALASVARVVASAVLP